MHPRPRLTATARNFSPGTKPKPNGAKAIPTTPAVSTPSLRAWFEEIIQTFPPINGPFAIDEDEVSEEDESLITDYSVGQQMICAGFAWSQADQAYDETFELAEKHRLGFFDASSDKAEVWLPDAKGHLRLAYSK